MDKVEAVKWLVEHGFHKTSPGMYRKINTTVCVKTGVDGRYSSGDSRHPFVSGYGPSPEESIRDLAKRICKDAESDSLDVLALIA